MGKGREWQAKAEFEGAEGPMPEGGCHITSPLWYFTS